MYWLLRSGGQHSKIGFFALKTWNFDGVEISNVETEGTTQHLLMCKAIHTTAQAKVSTLPLLRNPGTQTETDIKFGIWLFCYNVGNTKKNYGWLFL